jgi:hypothetical protein
VSTCPVCGSATVIPPEPPDGTWVRAVNMRPGATKRMTTQRRGSGWGEPGTMPFGKWEAMWQSWGPLEACGPWGADL